MEIEASKYWHFSVEGMHCIKCVRKIQSIGDGILGVESLEVDLSEARVSTRANKHFRPQDFLANIEKAGFQARLLGRLEKDSKKSHSPLIRLAIAGACAGNIMLLSASNYAGADQSELGLLFHWLSFLLFLPVLFYSAWPLLKNSVHSLFKKRVSVDIPLSLAIVGAASLSLKNLLVGKNEIYFDSLSMFVFFLLASRYIIFRLQEKYLTPVDLSDFFNQNTVLREKGGEWVETAIANLQFGDQILLRRNEFIPTDSEILSERVEIDNSIITGESFPVQIQRRGRVYAGSKLISSKAYLSVLEPVQSSRVTALLEKINKGLSVESQKELLADRGAQFLTLAIIAIAVASYLFFAIFDIPNGLDRILALLVIACPCALAIATPLAHSLSVRKGLKQGFLFKNVDALENLQAVTTVVFDKTGTLTQGEFKIESWPMGEPSSLQKQIISSLEQNSEHPVAISLKRAIGEVAVLPMQDLCEIAGSGVRGEYSGDLYQIRNGFDSNKKKVEILKNNEIWLSAILSDEVKEDSVKVLSELRKSNKELFLLTGDSNEVAYKVGAQLGFKDHEIVANKTPEQKTELVKALQKRGEKVLFVGDGVNDALAMRQADVSVSIYSSAEVTFKTSSIHLLEKSLKPLFKMFTLSRVCVQTIWINLFLSFLYNLSFAVFALLGLISPLVAVILMPLSSLTVVLLTYLNIQKKGEKSC